MAYPVENKTRIAITVEKSLLEKIDNYAKKSGVNRSAAISILVMQQLDQLDTVKTLNRIMDKIDAGTLGADE